MSRDADSQTSTKERLKRFFQLVPPESDMLLVVLKGHLLIEEQLHAIIANSLHNPEPVVEARLTFAQQLKLAEAAMGHMSKTLAWRAAEHLNGIRNKLVHRIEPGDIENLLQPFIGCCESDERFSRLHRKLPQELPKAYVFIFFVWATLATKAKVAQVLAEHGPIPPRKAKRGLH
jgi:hypothetical protein